MTRYEVTLISRVVVNGVESNDKKSAVLKAMQMYQNNKTKYEVYTDHIVLRER